MHFPSKDIASSLNMKVETPFLNEKVIKFSDDIAITEKINTKNVPPTTRAVEVTNVLREDVIEGSIVRDDLLDLGPNREGDFYRVPKIISE